MDTYLISRIPRERTDEFVARVGLHGSSLVGPQYGTSVRQVVRGGSSDTVITLFRNRHNPAIELYFEDESVVYVFSGYLVDDLSDVDSVRRLFGSTRGDARPIVRSPGGIYSYTTVRRSDGQVCAGHSTPTLEPVYYAATSSGLHVGNSPLLVHGAARDFATPQVSESFYFSAVNAGVAIDNATPFVGCYRVPPREVLVNHPANFGMTARPAPRPKYGRYRYSTYQQRRDAVAEAALRASSVLKPLPQGELRVSGGKDSRLVAASLKESGIEATPVNQNFPQEVEGQVADRVARALGAESCLRVSIERILSRDAIEADTRRKIAYAAGLPAVATLQYPARSEGSVAGVPLIMGHAHLQRGGLNVRIRSAEEAMSAAASRTVSPHLKQSFAEPNRQLVATFVNSVLGRRPGYAQGVSFHAYMQFAMNYQFQSLYSYVRNWNHLVTPLVDERFALLCEDIANRRSARRRNEFAGITDLKSERIAMGATEALAPSLLEFPLSGDRYRCDNPDWANFEMRDPSLIVPGEISASQQSRVFNTRWIDHDVRGLMWAQINSSVVSDFVSLTCRPEIWTYVSEPTSRAPDGENPVLLNQFLWRLYGLSVILGSDWWKELGAQ